MFNLFGKSFYQQVLSHVRDPPTWRSFALTCKFFRELCITETPARKMEFRVSIVDWLGTIATLHIHVHAPSRFHIPLVLPNGALHGTVKTGSDGSDADNVGDIREVDTGNGTEVRVISSIFSRSIIPIELPNYMRMFFIRNVLIVSDPWSGVRKTIFYNLTKTTFIISYSCCICNKLHTFGMAGSMFHYDRTCFETSYTLTALTNADWRKLLKRRRIARAILNYAKTIQ